MDTKVWIVGSNQEDYIYFTTEEDAKNHMMKLAHEKELRLKSPWVEVKVNVSPTGKEVEVSRRSIGMFVNGYFATELQLHYFSVPKHESITVIPPLPPRKNVFEEETIAGTTAMISEYTPGSFDVPSNTITHEYVTPSPVNLHERKELSPDGDYVLRKLTEEDSYVVRALMHDAPKRTSSGVNAYTWI